MHRIPNKKCDFKAFIDILFKVAKRVTKEVVFEKHRHFKKFLDDYIVPRHSLILHIELFLLTLYNVYSINIIFRYKELSLKFY